MKLLICDSLNDSLRSTETIRAVALCSPERDPSPPEYTADGSWSIWTGEQFKAEECY